MCGSFGDLKRALGVGVGRGVAVSPDIGRFKNMMVRKLISLFTPFTWWFSFSVC